jgi:hypothetical protein
MSLLFPLLVLFLDFDDGGFLGQRGRVASCESFSGASAGTTSS